MDSMFPDIFGCPICGGYLSAASNQLNCVKCNYRIPILDSIPSFLSEEQRESNFVRYSLDPRMKAIVDMAKTEGWENSIVHFANTNEYDFEYRTSEARADFRFLMPLKNQKGTVIDVGSGWGNISTAFARTAEKVIVIDSNLDNLNFVRTRSIQEGLENVTFAQADASRLPVLPETCDTILLVGVLEWIAWENPGDPWMLQKRALKNIYKALKPGGCLYIGIENRISFKYFLGIKEPHTNLRFISLLPYPIANRYSYYFRKKEYRELTYSPGGLMSLLKDIGFGSVKIWYPIPNYQYFRYLTDYRHSGIERYLLEKFRGHPKFSSFYIIAGKLAVMLNLHKQFSPGLCVFAYKQ